MTSRRREHRARCLCRLDVVGENLPLVPRRRLTIRVLESRHRAEGHRRPQSSAGATRAGVERGRTLRMSAPSALAVVWAVVQQGRAS
jgi:hypothetical protein